MKNDKNESVNIISNEAIIGKPYLDIDRVIMKGQSSISIKNNQKVGD
jgi:hypothetical protein